MKYSVKKAVRFPLAAWKWYISQYKGKWYQRIVASIASAVMFFFSVFGGCGCQPVRLVRQVADNGVYRQPDNQ